MALFRGQDWRRRGSHSQVKRGKLRAQDGGRRTGRGVNAPSAKTGNNRSFYASRVEDQEGDPYGPGSQTSETEQGKEKSPGSEDETEEEAFLKINQPYHILLETLNANFQRNGPPQKKRKPDSTDDKPPPPSPEVAMETPEPLEEPQDREHEGLLSEDSESDHAEDQGGPFTSHFADADSRRERYQAIADIKSNRWRVEKGPVQPECSYFYKHPESMKLAEKDWSRAVINTSCLRLKERLKPPAARVWSSLDPLTGHLASSISTYRDVLFPLRTQQNADTVRSLACLHTLNHVIKTRDRVVKDNARLAREGEELDLEFRDQGFTRPKVLIILPTRQSCVRYVDTIMSFCAPEQQENKKRFQDSYASGEAQFSDDKPADFRELFAGSDDDMFRLGMKFTRKTVKYFSNFYNSDIIFASPLGLRMAVGADESKQQDYDFLSSIEIVVVDQADAMLMQNWDHIEQSFQKFNLQPQQAHGCDFSRVKNWYLDGNAKYFRQTIIFSAFNFPLVNKLYLQHMLNIAGKVKYSKEEEGAMIGMAVSPKQTFSRFDFVTAASEPDDRFTYFSTAIVPSLRRGSRRSPDGTSGVLIFLPAYADFVRVRNYLAASSATQDISFGSISEYTSVKDVARARSHFLSGKQSVLLYTERAHHFRRYHLKGVKRIIMYGLPENPIFYKEVVGGFFEASIAAAKSDAREASVRALFSKLDMLKLERIVGSRRYLSMIKDKLGDTFDFAPAYVLDSPTGPPRLM
ncbi:MAG: hypothetical protein Q9163_004689 [Psora crenata]